MCEHCELKNCSILNKTECPINILWRQADEAKAKAERLEAIAKN